MCLMVLSFLRAVMYLGSPLFDKPISHVVNEPIALGARKSRCRQIYCHFPIIGLNLTIQVNCALSARNQCGCWG